MSSFIFACCLTLVAWPVTAH